MLLCSLGAAAEDDSPPPIPVEDKWDKKGDGDRSLSSSPSLTRDAYALHLYSEKQLDNLYIGITNLSGEVIYSETAFVPAGAKYAVSIEFLPAGTYYFTIVQGDKYIKGIMLKEIIYNML